MLEAAGTLNVDERDDVLRIECILLRPDRPLLLIVVSILLILLAYHFGNSLASIPVYALLALATGHLVFFGGGRREAVAITVADDGIKLIRGNGKRLAAPWRLFESVRLDRRAPYAAFAARQPWRVTLVNTFRPTIGAFLHSTASEHTIFYFPVQFEIEAERHEIEQLQQQLLARIRTAHEPRPAIEWREPPNPDKLMRLHECMSCGYNLTGLPRTGACPECGWGFEAGSFTLNVKRPMRRIGGVIALVPFVISVALWAAGLIGWLMIVVIVAPGCLAAALLIVTGRLMPESRVRRALITPHGIELWRRGTMWKRFAWRDLRELHAAQSDDSLWRIAAWTLPLWSVRYSTFLDTWRTMPPLPPTIIVKIDHHGEAGRLIRDEIERRWSDERS